MKIFIKNINKELNYDSIPYADIVESLNLPNKKNILIPLFNEHPVDWNDKLLGEGVLEFLDFSSEQGQDIYWHTSSHIMAQAVQRIFPKAKLAIGPSIDKGFYYDFDVENNFQESDLIKIEEMMSQIIKEDIPIIKKLFSKEEAIKFFKERHEIYKIELINEIADPHVSVYSQAEFADLCRGPHLMSTGKVFLIKLLRTSGAYWRGSEKNKMLQRIYAISFPDKKQMDEYLTQLEEAKKRDHNKLGREMELFTTADIVGQGLPLLMPKGAKIIQILERFVEDEEEKRGYQHTKTPFLAKSDLFKVSGHWDHYKEGMFIIGDESKDKELIALRPMTCPFQYLIYNSKLRSYRDLPLRYAETSTLFRNESSGEMHGLIRIRQFTLSDAHIICLPQQLEEEFHGVMDLVNFMMEKLGIQNDIWYRFSKWDPKNKTKYIDKPEAWEETERKMKVILDHLKIPYKEAVGEAAFYGPKLDIQFKNVHGKEDTIITIQIDMALAERFDMNYIDSDGTKKRPIIIHRSTIGCYERTLAMLIEKYAGAFPTWLAPTQVMLITITDDQIPYAKSIEKILKENNIRVELDGRSEKMGVKIKDAILKKIPYMFIMGKKEEENNSVSVRTYKQGDIGSFSTKDIMDKIRDEIVEKKI